MGWEGEGGSMHFCVDAMTVNNGWLQVAGCPDRRRLDCYLPTAGSG